MNNKSNKKIPDNNWILFGVMFGGVVGLVLSLKFDNLLFLGGGVIAGLLFGSLVDSGELDGKDVKLAVKKPIVKKTSSNKKTVSKKKTSRK